MFIDPKIEQIIMFIGQTAQTNPQREQGPHDHRARLHGGSPSQKDLPDTVMNQNYRTLAQGFNV